MFYLVRFPDWLESQSGERTPQELGKKLWSHITQKFSWVIIKSWCLLENCTHGEATDVGVTHSQSLVARQEAVLGRCAFATWVGARLQVQFAAAVTWISLNFQRYLPIGISFHITVPSIHSEKRLFEQVKWMVANPAKLWNFLEVKIKKGLRAV